MRHIDLPLFFHITDELLLESYMKAVELKLSEDFINLLKKEMIYRNLKK